MKQKHYSTLFLIFLLSGIILAACASPTPQIVEVTREVPQTIVVTQVITQVVTPEPSFTPTSTQTPIPILVIQSTPTSLPTQPTMTYGETNKLKQFGYAVYYPIEGCGASIVRPSFDVYVSAQGGKNAIRSTSDISSPHNIIGYALPGEHLKVVSGPVCSWGWLMWMVETDYGLTGWTPESDGSTFWLIPDTSGN